MKKLATYIDKNVSSSSYMNMERTERQDNLLLHVWLVKLQSLTKTDANHTHCSDRSIWMESLLRGPSRHVNNQETRQEAKQDVTPCNALHVRSMVLAFQKFLNPKRQVKKLVED